MKDCCLSTNSDKECIRKKDKKTFKLPRKFSKIRCLSRKGIKGFTMRSSCAPYKGCKKMKGGNHHDNIAYFAGGCFWSVQEKFNKLPGILKTEVGFMGGKSKKPTYKKVLTDKTGHAETVKVSYTNELSYTDLLNYFFSIHDPTSLNKQGADIGTRYRSIVFYSNDKEKKDYLKFLKLYKNKKKVVTELKKVDTFYKAKEYHQHYNLKNKCNNKNPLTEDKDTYYRICHNNTKFAEKKYSGKYDTSYINKKGHFICPCCSNKLYKTSDMFNSKTGWPAFSKPFNNRSIKYNSETSELTCFNCELHLGHRTFDGPPPSNIHDCINSVCLHFIELKGGSKKYKSKQKNMNKKTLKICSIKPLTGYNRSGYCETDMFDMGSHLVCAKMNKKFLKYTKSMGNDLSTPSSSFPGLKPGDKWCLCQDRWNESYNANVEPKVIKNATNLSIKDEVRDNINNKSKKGGGNKYIKKTVRKMPKKQFLYNPNNPKKSFDVYIDKDPTDTISIKYTTIKDVKKTIKKLEKLYKSNKHSHKRIWQVGMIMYVRLKVLKKKKPKEFKLSEKYFKFLGKRTKIKDERSRKKFKFKY